ncbi:uncharacterized protein B0I36DRAFT_366346 [Microdochium trichocladiopsis]|uniref:GPI anchored protein n=1 Tax=Microdochium trichocladiopsis TaxID=1682393 RepID=A0A9P8Y056_9PEZI|nr:uncharacterized protein B0I36DRAFT_366346 [Microdochium trichocladiopsis]KAH7024397.1 hypothetical protein B0I36DRAFT_366346 [Microdochium trichocladiopsis]
MQLSTLLSLSIFAAFGAAETIALKGAPVLAGRGPGTVVVGGGGHTQIHHKRADEEVTQGVGEPVSYTMVEGTITTEGVTIVVSTPSIAGYTPSPTNKGGSSTVSTTASPGGAAGAMASPFVGGVAVAVGVAAALL